MKKLFVNGCILLILLIGSNHSLIGQFRIDSLLPIRGLSIASPSAATLDSFIIFINKELAPRKVNTLILRVDYNYQYKSHPELVEPSALSLDQVKKIVSACKQNKISIIPQVNLLGHQSWANKTGKLLEQYPQFDETPHIKIPEKYVWPNADNLYCKSYCPLHPDVHKVVFDVVDEICDAFESSAFHAGLDEVFYIGDDKCPRCGGKDKAELFAGEVNTLNNHLKQKGRELWIWADRLLDGKATGLGMWEGSYNNTHRAVDMIAKDVVLCDWHYERPDKTAVYFAMKGFRVVTCPWRKPEVSVLQVRDMVAFRQQSTPQMKDRFYGVVGTVWSSVGSFLNGYYGKQPAGQVPENMAPWNSFRAMYDEMQKISAGK